MFSRTKCQSKIDFLKEDAENFIEFIELANGSFGKVYKAKHLLLDLQKKVAVKFNASKSKHQKEVELMTLFSHENLIAISGSVKFVFQIH